MGLMRKLVRAARPVVYAVPGLGHAARYAKRLVTLPWNFHRHFQATAAHRADTHARLHALAAAQTAHQDISIALANAQTQALADHVNLVSYAAVRQELAAALPPLVDGHLRRGVTDPVREAVLSLFAEVRRAQAEMAAEVRAVNDRHATCYDRLVELLRQQTAQLRALAEAQDDLTRQLADLAAGADDSATRLRLTA